MVKYCMTLQGNMSVLRSFKELGTAYLYRVKYRIQGNMSVLRSFTELDTAYLYRVKYRIQGNMSLLCTFTELGTMCLYRELSTEVLYRAKCTCAGLGLEHLSGAAVLVLQNLYDDGPGASLTPSGLEAPPLQAGQLTGAP